MTEIAIINTMPPCRPLTFGTVEEEIAKAKAQLNDPSMATYARAMLDVMEKAQ